MREHREWILYPCVGIGVLAQAATLSGSAGRGCADRGSITEDLEAHRRAGVGCGGGGESVHFRPETIPIVTKIVPTLVTFKHEIMADYRKTTVRGTNLLCAKSEISASMFPHCV
jgi:hypothetical protein